MSRLFTLALAAIVGFIAWHYADPQGAFEDLVIYVRSWK